LNSSRSPTFVHLAPEQSKKWFMGPWWKPLL